MSAITYIPFQTCTYIGNGSGCSSPVATGRNYCEHHLWTVYQQGTQRAKRKREVRVANAVWDLQSELNKAIEELEAEGFDCYGRT